MPLHPSSGRNQDGPKGPGGTHRLVPKFLYGGGWIIVFLMAAMVSAAVAAENDDLAMRRPQPHGFSMTVQAPLGRADDRSLAYDEKFVGKLDPDTVFRRYMLPGVALLVIIFAVVLIAIFFPRPKPK